MCSKNKGADQLHDYREKCCYAWQLLHNVDVYTHAQFQLNAPCGPRFLSVFANC